MAFDSWVSPEVITAISAAVGSILGAAALFYKRVKGKPWRELLAEVYKDGLKKEAELAKEAIHSVENVCKVVHEVEEKRKEEKPVDTESKT